MYTSLIPLITFAALANIAAHSAKEKQKKYTSWMMIIFHQMGLRTLEKYLLIGHLRINFLKNKYTISNSRSLSRVIGVYTNNYPRIIRTF